VVSAADPLRSLISVFISRVHICKIKQSITVGSSKYNLNIRFRMELSPSTFLLTLIKDLLSEYSICEFRFVV
jgi:hypothetical protein